MSNRQKHLEFIQGVVNRLANASFRLKGWAVVLVSALFVLTKETWGGLVPVSLLPVLFFWALDGYVLWQERLFRALYDHVRGLEEDSMDLSMDVNGLGRSWKQSWAGATFLHRWSCSMALSLPRWSRLSYCSAQSARVHKLTRRVSYSFHYTLGSHGAAQAPDIGSFEEKEPSPDSNLHPQ